MIIARTLAELRQARENITGRVGFIPTMGALHSGHISLVEEASKTSDAVVVSIFVNPTQFNNSSDFKTYPREVGKDCELLSPHGVDIVFIPTVEEIYPSSTSCESKINLGGLDNYGEGPMRPGHFDGVAQVVSRLFDIVQPTEAFFGDKDFQQLAIIRYFSAELYPEIKIVGCPIKRAEDGLALSSRNELLSIEQRKAAPHIFHCIKQVEELSKTHTVENTIKILKKLINSNDFLEVEYVEIINALTLRPVENWNEAEDIQLTCAVYARPVRLIDNIKIR